MSMEAAVATGELSPFEQLRFARQVILTESRARWPRWPTGWTASSAGRSS